MGFIPSSWRRVLLGSLLAVAIALSASCARAGGELYTGQRGLEEATGFTATRWDGLLRGHEQRLVDCMQSRGFKFWSTANWSYLTLGPHGLFGLTTPSAESAYLKTHGYGVTQRVIVLADEEAAIRKPSNETYVSKLSRERRVAYSKALLGDDRTEGCVQPQSDVVLQLGLPDGGELGDGFARALHEARESGRYQAWQERVVSCLVHAEVEVPSGDLMQVERPFLERLLALADSEYVANDDGSIEYKLSSAQAAAIPQVELRTLRRDEMRTAAIEARCREQAGSGAQDAVDAASAALVNQYHDEVTLLRSALRRVE